MSAPQQTEADFQRAVIDMARISGWAVYHTFDSRHSAAGFTDLVLVRGDVIVFAELKTAKGQLRPAQREWLAALAVVADATPVHVKVRVWRPDDWADIEATLKRDLRSPTA